MADYDFGTAGPSSTDDGHSAITNILKGLSPASKQTKDGQPQKRRGPKPDSKPALTKRQEMNRQAQRTHRERKEKHIKDLEQKVLALNELWQSAINERDQAKAEVARLNEMLRTHGIHVDIGSPSTVHNCTVGSLMASTNASISGSGRHDSSTTATTSPSPYSVGNPRSPTQSLPGTVNQSTGQRMDYDQIGIDFVLALEHPCMEHLQYLLVRSHNADQLTFKHPMEHDDGLIDHMSGHALMLSCPPMSHIMNKPDIPWGLKMPDVPKADLMKLFRASSCLPTDTGELTPVQAWMTILRSERAASMTVQQFQIVQAELSTKVRCYGFGAVMDAWEVKDAMDKAINQVNMELISGVGDFSLDGGLPFATGFTHMHNHQQLVM